MQWMSKVWYRKPVFWGLLFWILDKRWFFPLILMYLIYTCNIKVKDSMEFLVWVGKTRNTLCTWKLHFSKKQILQIPLLCLIWIGLFQRGETQGKSSVTLLAIKRIKKSFQMMYCLKLFLKWHWEYKVLFLLSRNISLFPVHKYYLRY